MGPQDRPLALRGLAGLVQDRRVNGQLSDVVQQRSPPEPVLIIPVETQLLGKQVGVHPDPLGMSASASVMARECCK